jgi:hypothetical protein
MPKLASVSAQIPRWGVYPTQPRLWKNGKSYALQTQ